MLGADHTVSRLMGLRITVKRVMLYQIGCYGGAAVLRICKELAQNNKGARVPIIISEVTCVTFRAPLKTHADGLVEDGATSYVQGSDPKPAVKRPIFEIKWAGKIVVPESDGAIDGHLTKAGLVFCLLKDVPDSSPKTSTNS